MTDSTEPPPPVDRFAWERALRASQIEGNALLVLLTLATHMDRDGTNGRPSQRTLAGETGLGDRTVRRHLAEAVEAGWLVQVSRGHRRGDGAVRASVYNTSLPATPGRLTCTSTGHTRPVDPTSTGQSEHLNRPNGASQPATRGHLPSPIHQEKNKPRTISEQHQAVAANGLQQLRRVVRKADDA